MKKNLQKIFIIILMCVGLAPLFAHAQNLTVTFEAKDQAVSESQPATKYQKIFDITPNLSITGQVAVTMKFFQGSQTVGNPFLEMPVTLTGNLTTTPTVDGFLPGSYVGAVYNQTAKISNTISFTITSVAISGADFAAPAGGPNGENASFPPILLGTFKIIFPPENQVITGTSAKIKGTLSTAITNPITLSAVFGPKGQPFNAEKPLLTIGYPGLIMGETRGIDLEFNGLVPGQTYQFAFKNGGTVSSTISFTTPNGGTIPNPVFDSNVLGVNSNPGGFSNVEDTISDKGIVPKCGRTQNAEGTVPENELRMCTYKDFLQLISNVVQYAIIVIGPILGIFVLYSGFMIIWLGKEGDPTAEIMKELKKHKARLVRIAIGIAIMLSSYLIVMTIIRELGVKPEYTLIDILIQ